jgi:hypothetical protein
VLRDRSILPIEADLSSPGPDHSQQRRKPPTALAADRDVEHQLLNDHYRRWLDEPLPALEGRSPREASRGTQRDELELLLRGIENRVERAGRGGAAWPDLSWLREELGLNAGRLAA